MPAGGRFTNKTVPSLKDDTIGFGADPSPCDWTTHTIKIFGMETTFTRTVDTDGVVSVATDCDPPDMLLLARKGDRGYWSGNTWSKHHKDRRLWSADIARRMLEEGLVATGWEPDTEPIRTAMLAASSPRSRTAGTGLSTVVPHALTTIVAQLRGLRLIESSAPAEGWATKLGGYNIPARRRGLLSDCFSTAAGVYRWLPPPPWDDADPVGVVPWRWETIWGDRSVSAGHGPGCFVGDHGDLVWRALTETNLSGLSPLKNKLRDGYDGTQADWDMIATAVLYDDVAARQLTTDLFVGVETSEQPRVRSRTLKLLDYALNPQNYHGPRKWSAPDERRWSPTEQQRIRGFVETVEAL